MQVLPQLEAAVEQQAGPGRGTQAAATGSPGPAGAAGGVVSSGATHGNGLSDCQQLANSYTKHSPIGDCTMLTNPSYSVLLAGLAAVGHAASAAAACRAAAGVHHSGTGPQAASQHLGDLAGCCCRGAATGSQAPQHAHAARLPRHMAAAARSQPAAARHLSSSGLRVSAAAAALGLHSIPQLLL